MLTELQQQALKANLDRHFKDILLERADTINRAFTAITEDAVYQQNKETFQFYRILGAVDELRRVYTSNSGDSDIQKDTLEYIKQLIAGYQADLPKRATAETLFNNKNYSGAIAELDRLIKENPENPSYYFLRAQCYLKLGDNAEKDRKNAAADFSKAIEYHPKGARIWVELGFTLENLGEHKEAMRAYTEALKYNPEQHFALYRRGGLHMLSGNRAAGETDFAASLVIRNNDPSTYGYRGELYLSLYEDYIKAIEDLKKAEGLGSNNPDLPKITALRVEAERLQAQDQRPSSSQCRIS